MITYQVKIINEFKNMIYGKKILGICALLATVPYMASADVYLLGQRSDDHDVKVSHKQPIDNEKEQPEKENNRCASFELDACPENGTCTSCDTKFRLIKCADGYVMSDNSCELSNKICDVFNPHAKVWEQSKYPNCGNVGYPNWNGVCWKCIYEGIPATRGVDLGPNHGYGCHPSWVNQNGTDYMEIAATFIYSYWWPQLGETEADKISQNRWMTGWALCKKEKSDYDECIQKGITKCEADLNKYFPLNGVMMPPKDFDGYHYWINNTIVDY